MELNQDSQSPVPLAGNQFRQQGVEVDAVTGKRLLWYILIACCIGSAAKLLEPPIWIYNPPPDMPFEAAWVHYRIFSTFTCLATVIFVLAGGVLGDLFGRKRVMLIGFTGYAIGNVLLMLFPSPVWYFTIRTMTVAFGAVAIPLTLALIKITIRGRVVAAAIAVYTISNALAGQIAWIQGQFLAAYVGWRAPYVIPAIVAVVAIIMIQRVIPESKAGGRRFLDLLVYSGWTLIVCTGFFVASAWPVDDDRWWVMVGLTLLVSGIGTGLIIWWKQRLEKAGFKQSKFRIRDLTALIVTGIVLNFALLGYCVRVYSYFQIDQLFTQVVSFIALWPVLVGSIIGLYLIVNSVRKWQARAVIALGLLVMGVSSAITAALPTGTSYLFYILPLFAFGIGYLVAVTIWVTAFLRSDVNGYHGLNASINKASGLLGATIGASITGALLTALGFKYYRDYIDSLNLPQAEVEAAQVAFQNLMATDPAGVSPFLQQFHNQFFGGYVVAYAAAFDTILYIIAMICGSSAVVVWMGLRRSLRAEQVSQEDIEREDNIDAEDE